MFDQVRTLREALTEMVDALEPGTFDGPGAARMVCTRARGRTSGLPSTSQLPRVYSFVRSMRETPSSSVARVTGTPARR